MANRYPCRADYEGERGGTTVQRNPPKASNVFSTLLPGFKRADWEPVEMYKVKKVSNGTDVFNIDDKCILCFVKPNCTRHIVSNTYQGSVIFIYKGAVLNCIIKAELCLWGPFGKFWLLISCFSLKTRGISDSSDEYRWWMKTLYSPHLSQF